jgi:hypothetical protein
MKRIAVPALLIGTMLPSGATAAPAATRVAYATEGPARGPLCGLDALDSSGESRSGTLVAGPLALVDPTHPGAVHRGTVTCTVQVGGALHSAPDTVAVTGRTATAAVGAYGRAAFAATGPVYLCTQVVIDGTPLYWDDDGTPAGLRSRWSPSAAARCGLAAGATGDDPYGLVTHAVEGLPPVTSGCSDGKDNDDDGAADYPADTGCSDLLDPTESPLPIQCSDGRDNDADGLADYPADPGCMDPLDPDEDAVRTPFACSDGIDNDADGLVDYPSDKDCATPVGVTEDATGCTAAAGHTACATLVPTSLVQRFAVRVPVTNWSHVVGYLDTYQFTLPAGPVEVPCLVLTKGAVTLNPCQDLGGRYVSRGPALVDEYLGEAKGLPAVPFATIGICTADLVVTVDGYATTGPPAYTVC